MQFPGYWVILNDDGSVSLRSAVFDETELDPATNWKEAWQNQSEDVGYKGFVGLEPALAFVAKALAAKAGATLSDADLERAMRFEPNWNGDRCDIPSLAHFLGKNCYSTT